MKTLVAALGLLALTAPAIAGVPFDKKYEFEIKQCGLAPDVPKCAVKLASCHAKLFRKLSAENPTANLGMALYYHCLEEQHVGIVGVD